MKFFLSVQKLRFLCRLLAISVILVGSHLLIHLLTDDIPETSVSLDRESAVGNFGRRLVVNNLEVFSVFVLSWHYFNF